MHLGTLRVSDTLQRAAVLEGDEWVLLDSPDVGSLISDPTWRERVAEHRGGAPRISRDEATLLTPVQRPTKIICCGLNYHDHILETGREIPKHPTLFAKFSDTLTAPEADITIVGSERVDWEAELAVVIGSTIQQASPTEAAAAILGYAAANDVSCRDWQSRTLQWFQGKAWDHTTPLGPVIVTADEISPKDGLAIRADIDGETVQSSNTKELVFDSADLVAYISSFTTLRPGDIVLTGTPGGVGLGMSPQRWLRDGELLTTHIEGIGTLRNRMRLSNPVSAQRSSR